MRVATGEQSHVKQHEHYTYGHVKDISGSVHPCRQTAGMGMPVCTGSVRGDHLFYNGLEGVDNVALRDMKSKLFGAGLDCR